MTAYILGIDSGGTKYQVKACDLTGRVLGDHIGDPAPHYRFTEAEALRRINDNIDRCLHSFGGRRDECRQIVCGTTGIDTDGDQIVVDKLYARLGGFTCPVTCVNDAEVAQRAVTGEVGVVVVAGTGSIAFGRNGVGDSGRSGGWPISIFGDEGSGTWISHRALNHLARLFDGRAQPTLLGDRLRDALRITEPAELKAISIEVERFTWNDPGLAALVDEAAAAGDRYALAILRDAARHTFELGDCVVGKLRLHDEPRFRVGAWGSAIANSETHFRLFKEHFERKYDNVDVLLGDTDAAMGACAVGLAMVRD